MWSEVTETKLKQWCSGNYTASQMAVMFFEEHGLVVTRNAVIGKVHRMGFRLGLLQGKKTTDVVRPNRGGEPKRARTIRHKAPTVALPVFEAVNEPEPLRISLLDLNNSHCRWVCDGTDDNCLPTYCGHQCVAETSWCAHHYGRTHTVR